MLDLGRRPAWVERQEAQLERRRRVAGDHEIGRISEGDGDRVAGLETARLPGACQAGGAARLAMLRNAALADEHGTTLDRALAA